MVGAAATETMAGRLEVVVGPRLKLFVLGMVVVEVEVLTARDPPTEVVEEMEKLPPETIKVKV